MRRSILRPVWIWGAPEGRNVFLRFRRGFTVARGGEARLRVSADSRYWVYVDGRYLGTGPVRSWPEHWKFDEYTVPLSPGRHVVAVLVNHFGEGNFQYLPAPAGLWVELKAGGQTVVSDGRWKCRLSRACGSQVPRISVQQAFEEQFDARREDGWLEVDYDDSGWKRARVVAPPHPGLVTSGIPALTREPVFPRRVVRAEAVRPATQTWTLNVKPSYAPDDFGSNMTFVSGHLFTQVWSGRAQTVSLVRPHYHGGFFKLNGRTVPALPAGDPFHAQEVRLRAGWNRLLFPFPALEMEKGKIKAPWAVHVPWFVLAMTAAEPLRWSATGKAGGAPWAFLGPFAFAEGTQRFIREHMDYPRVVVPKKIDAAADEAVFAKLLRTGGAEAEKSRWFRPLRGEQIVTEDVAVSAFADRVQGAMPLQNPEALLSDNEEWSVLDVPPKGCDARILIDFGRELLGSHVFEVEAAAGTILDVHNFEFIQPDGRENYAEGMNNTFRYVCREGRQSFRTLRRRGFQYSWLIVRGQRGPVRIRTFHAEFNSYPQARRGSFMCSDEKLNRIWEVGAHTLRCCAEDTYTDCPSYEQTHWVGDGRNEALVDWVVNGDSRLWFRCLEQTAQSLERSPLTLSQVPSAWENVIPLWSFLWMRSCREYLLWTGDDGGARRLLPWVRRNVGGIEQHLNARGLFEIQAWNMFDWAEMDMPCLGVITHLNCFASLALEDGAEMAEWLGDRAMARKFRARAKSIRAAINRHLWNSQRRAYLDSIHADGKRSTVFSQQTQTAALVSGVATGARGRRCRELMRRPPAGFVKAGSPFFEFFMLEVLAKEGKGKEFLDMIRRDWGFMIEQGASTFWEMWSMKTGRLTRSHCHGWSAAPTFFLSTVTLGVQPLRPGFAEISFSPQLGDLEFVRGAVPTPHGPIEVECRRRGGRIEKSLRLPKGVRLRRS